jgi:hypothetical protein
MIPQRSKMTEKTSLNGGGQQVDKMASVFYNDLG